MNPIETEAPAAGADVAQPIDLTTAGGRAALTPSAQIYWRKLSAGKAIGYRKTTADEDGAWWARWRDAENGRQVYERLGDLRTVPPGKRYARADELANAWFKACERGLVQHAGVTVADAIDRHERAIKRVENNPKKAGEFRRQMARHVIGTDLAQIALQRLTNEQTEEWRAALIETPASDSGEPLARATVNRIMTRLRAALNRAFDDGLVVSNRGWKRALKRMPGRDGRRTLDLDRTQRAAWIAACEPDAAALLKALSLLPLRPGAMAAFKVSDYTRRTRALLIDKDKEGEGRHVILPEATAALFDDQCRNKVGTAPIFMQADGSPWTNAAWCVPFKAAALAAGLPPETVAYTMRHSVISDLVIGRLDLHSIAKISGTSVKMIEEHYGHLRADSVTDALALLAA